MEEPNTQWHPGFIGAMDLEFREDRGMLSFEKEHNLNTKPLQIDLLIIKKEGAGSIHNEIGRIFRKYNIVEYKSPGQHLDEDVWLKSLSSNMGEDYLRKVLGVLLIENNENISICIVFSSS